MSKIKSIKLKENVVLKAIEDFNNPIPEEFLDYATGDGSMFFEIEYEKPQNLKRPDGSLISEPDDGTKIIFISEQSFKIKNWIIENERPYRYTSESIWQFRLAQGLIFLPEDQHLAEKKAKMLTKQLEIQHEIDRLNAEQNWIPNIQSSSQAKYFFGLDNNGLVTYFYIEKANYTCNPQAVLMSSTTISKIILKYSQDELKQYLGIII